MGRVTPLDEDAQVAPGIRAFASPGHRPSHLSYELATGKHRLLDAGDAMIAPVLVEHPTRGNAFDSDPAEGVRSRLALLRRAARPDTTTYVAHFPFPGFLRIVEHETRFSWEAWQPFDAGRIAMIGDDGDRWPNAKVRGSGPAHRAATF